MEKQTKKPLWIALLIAIALILILTALFTGTKSSPSPGQTAETAQEPSPTQDLSSSHQHSDHTSEQAPDHTSAYTSASEQQAEDEAKNDPLSAYLSEQDEIMADMMEQMAVSPTGSASLDFLIGMVPHHQSAIDMAKSYLKYGGNNETLRQLAETIIEDQNEELIIMNRLIEEIRSSGETDQEKEQGYLEQYNQMMGSHSHMSHNTASASDVEYAFAEGMMMHHQMAVDMSEAVLAFTDHGEVRQLAENIIKAQKEEITVMKGILENSMNH